jgi:hypothetical protein
MKHKFITQVETEIELELPIYFKVTEFNAYFSLYENKAIIIWGDFSINTSNYPDVYFRYLNEKTYVKITEAEFKTKLVQECNLLISKS